MTSAWNSSHAPSRAWSRGSWTLELRDDEIADLRFDGRMVLRSIRAVVRDRDWNTADLVVEDVEESVSAIVLTVRTREYGADLSGNVRVEVSADEISVEMSLVSEDEFWANRIGLVVLHPPSVAGSALHVVHADGSQSSVEFPEAISAHQPAFDIRELAWMSNGLDLDVRFAGEVFEMEDQRNWTDASFKTYSRPLSQPFPYRVGTGERVHQRVAVRAHVGSPIAEASSADRIELFEGGAFPEIVLGAATAPDPAPLDSRTDASIGQARFVELDLASPNWTAALARAAATGLPLDVRLVLASAPESLSSPESPSRRALAAVARELRHLSVARVAVFQRSGPSQHMSDVAATNALRAALADAGVAASVIGGSRAHFTELNREGHRLPDDLEGVAFSSTPLFHSRGTEQLVESVAMQRLTARQGVVFARGLPVHIGLVSLRPRFNDVATTAAPAASGASLDEGYGPQLLGGDADDARQDASELSAWTIASAAAFAVPGVASIAFFEEWGPRGLRDGEGRERPAAAALRALSTLSGSTLLWGSSPDGLVWAIGGRGAAGTSVLIANLDTRERDITIVAGSTSSRASMSVHLEASTFAGCRMPQI
ncbi:MAG: hypothetical protein KKH75_09830 [Actinobacteria bacterium]|nr:hypothetical protein [Actinomycetota bacterium]